MVTILSRLLDTSDGNFSLVYGIVLSNQKVVSENNTRKQNGSKGARKRCLFWVPFSLRSQVPFEKCVYISPKL